MYSHWTSLILKFTLAQVNFDLHLTLFSTPLIVVYLVLSWLSSLGVFSVIVLIMDGFYFSTSSFSVCEPHYRQSM